MSAVTITGKSGKCRITIEGEWTVGDIPDDIASWGEIDIEGCDCISSLHLRPAEAKEAFVAVLNAYRAQALSTAGSDPSSGQTGL